MTQKMVSKAFHTRTAAVTSSSPVILDPGRGAIAHSNFVRGLRLSGDCRLRLRSPSKSALISIRNMVLLMD